LQFFMLDRSDIGGNAFKVTRSEGQTARFFERVEHGSSTVAGWTITRVHGRVVIGPAQREPIGVSAQQRALGGR
jgi:hypothetical protein